MARVHARTFEHYRAWCAFVGVTARCFESVRAGGSEDSAIHEQLQDVCDYFMIWSGCENLRRVMSYVCELFHRRQQAAARPNAPQSGTLAFCRFFGFQMLSLAVGKFFEHNLASQKLVDSYQLSYDDLEDRVRNQSKSKSLFYQK